MSTTEFASAVAAVRAMEGALLSQSDIEHMIVAADHKEIADILVSCGRTVPENRNKLLNSLENELEEVWSFISDFVPNSKELEILIYRNNFHNLKAAFKALIMNINAEEYFIKPTSLNLSELSGIVAAKRFDELPDYMREPAAETYGILTRTLDGQLADAVLDTAALKAMQNNAERYGGEFMKKYAQLLTVCADIKTAYRCSTMQKSEAFMEIAVCGSRELDKISMIRAALKGSEGFISYLEETAYYEAAEMLKKSTALFEKWCDDNLTSLAEDAKMKCFGTEPLAAYFIAKETEIKNIRILLVCKSCGVSKEIITERMRKLYV